MLMVALPACRVGWKLAVPTWKHVVTPASLPGLLFLMVTSASRIFEATAAQTIVDAGCFLVSGHRDQAAFSGHHWM